MEERYDELMLGTTLMRGIVSRLIARAVRKQTGIDVVFDLDKLQVSTTESSDTIQIRARASCDIKKDDFKRLIEQGMRE